MAVIKWRGHKFSEFDCFLRMSSSLLFRFARLRMIATHLLVQFSIMECCLQGHMVYWRSRDSPLHFSFHRDKEAQVVLIWN